MLVDNKIFYTGEDYRLEQSIIRFTRDTTTQCVSIILVQDNLVESRETVLVRMTSIDSKLITTTSPDILTVIIDDSDSKLLLFMAAQLTQSFSVSDLRVGFTQPMYTALESFSTFELCTRLEAGQVAADRNVITVRFTVTPETAISEPFTAWISKQHNTHNYVHAQNQLMKIL